MMHRRQTSMLLLLHKRQALPQAIAGGITIDEREGLLHNVLDVVAAVEFHGPEVAVLD